MVDWRYLALMMHALDYNGKGPGQIPQQVLQRGQEQDCEGHRVELIDVRLCTNLDRQVMSVAHPPTKTSGSTISGVTEPCRRRKTGHFECLLRSMGPIWRESSV